MITRWICEKDDKKWIYPVGKCLYCKEPVTKQKSTKAKIIGVTKVNIPSPMHPITPYTVILLEDEYGNRMPKKTMKNYDIGDEFSIKEAKNEDAVIVSKIKYNLDESLEESFSLMKNIAIKEGDKVLIKVSIIEPAYPYQAVTTNPKLLDSIISYLKSLGVNDIVVAEQSILGNTEDAAKKAGILNVCKKQEVEFVDLSTSEYEKKEKEGFEFNVAKEALERKIINVPVMKTHSQITVAGAMENLTRLTDKKTQYKIYKEGIGKTFSVLTSLFPDIVNVGDATIGMHGQGPTVLGEPAFLNMIFTSKDASNLDRIFTEMGMFDVPSYLSGGNISEIEVVGDELMAIKFRLNAARKESSAHTNINIINGNADPLMFMTVLKSSSKLMGLLGGDVNIAIGNKLEKEILENKKRIIACGNDAINKMKELGITPAAEITEKTDPIEGLMMIKSIIENPDKEKISGVDKVKSKMAKFGLNIKKALK